MLRALAIGQAILLLIAGAELYRSHTPAADPYLGFSVGFQLVEALEITAPALLLQTRQPGWTDQKIIWSEGLKLPVGERLTVLGTGFESLHAGTGFVKVKRPSGEVGYLTASAFVASTTPRPAPSFQYPPAVLAVDGRQILSPYPVSAGLVKFVVDEIADKTVDVAFSTPLTAGKAHPVTAGNHLLVMLLSMLTCEDEGLRAQGLEAARRVFDEYVVPAKIEVRPGVIGWPNTYDFPTAWGQTLKAPWLSGYSNGVFANAAALMFRLTGEQRYAEIARQAVAWMRLEGDQGGGLYHDGQLPYVAEYPSAAPAEPNIGILDGEMMAAVTVYNTAILLDDPVMLRFAAQLAYSLVDKCLNSTTADGRIENGRYQWLVNTESYILPMKRLVAELGIITKDKRMLELAERWRISDVYWPN